MCSPYGLSIISSPPDINPSRKISMWLGTLRSTVLHFVNRKSSPAYKPAKSYPISEKNRGIWSNFKKLINCVSTATSDFLFISDALRRCLALFCLFFLRFLSHYLLNCLFFWLTFIYRSVRKPLMYPVRSSWRNNLIKVCTFNLFV